MNKEQSEYYTFGLYHYYTGSGYIQGGGIPPVTDYKFGSRWIDTLFPYPPDMPVRTSTLSWVYPYTSIPRLLYGYLNSLPDYPFDPSDPGETLGYTATPGVHPGTIVFPTWNMLCNLYTNRIDNSAPTQAKADTARAIVYAHELSHTRMQNHPLDPSTVGLMAYPDWNQAFVPYTTYVETDFRIIALALPRQWAYGGR